MTISPKILVAAWLAMAGSGAIAQNLAQLNAEAIGNLGREPVKALRLAERARREADSSGNRRQLFTALHTQAVALSEAGAPSEAEKVIGRAARVADMLGNDTLRAQASNTLGYLQMNKGDGAAAATTLRKAYAINNRLGNELAAHKNQLNLAILDYYFFNRPAPGLAGMAHVRRWAKSHKEYALLNSVLSNLAGIAIGKQRPGEAKALLAEAIEANAASANSAQEIFNLNELAMLDLDAGSLKAADAGISKALKLAVEAGLASEQAWAYHTASRVQEAQGNAAIALKYYKISTHLHDSLNQAQKAQAAELSALVIDAERQVRENEVLRRDRQIQSQKITLQRTLMVLGGILALVLACLLGIAINSNRKVRLLVDMLRKQNQAIVAQKEEIQQFNANLEALVEERTRQILDYASYNSHIIRGPLARIMGLSFLMQHSENEEDTHFYMQKMHESASEMDRAIKVVNRKLELEESDYVISLNKKTKIRHVAIMKS